MWDLPTFILLEMKIFNNLIIHPYNFGSIPGLILGLQWIVKYKYIILKRTFTSWVKGETHI